MEKKKSNSIGEKILISIIISILVYLAQAFITGELVFDHPDELRGAIAASLLVGFLAGFGFLGKDND